MFVGRLAKPTNDRQQRDDAEDPDEDARVLELEEEGQDAGDEEQEGDVRVGEDADEAAERVRADLLDRGAGRGPG